MCQKQHPNIVSEQNWQVIHNKDKVDENRDRTHLTHHPPNTPAWNTVQNIPS